MAYYDDIYNEEMRKRKLANELFQRSMQPGGTYTSPGPYGRAAYTGLGKGLTNIGQALIYKNAMEKSDERLQKAREEEESKRDEAIDKFMQTYYGKEAIPARTAPLMGPDEFPDGEQIVEPPQPSIPGDKRRAIIEALSNPYTHEMGKALLKAEGGRGAYFTPRETVMPDGSIRYQIFDHRSGRWKDTSGPTSPKTPKTQREIAAAKAGGKITGGSQAQAEIDLPKAEITTKETTQLVDELVNHPGMKDVIGFPDNPLALKGLVPGTDAADFRNRLDQLTGRTFIEVFPTLKGGGQITEIEGQKAQDAINRMSTATSEKAFIQAANDFKTEVNRLKEEVRMRAGKPSVKESEILRFDAQGNQL